MTRRAAVAGAGLIGRVLALELLDRGWQVTLFDWDRRSGKESCAYSGAGMLAPYSELEKGDEFLCRLGVASLELWPGFLEKLGESVWFRQLGSLWITHRSDEGDLLRLRRKLEAQPTTEGRFREATAEDIRELEPALADRFNHGIFLPQEAHLDSRQLLDALCRTLSKRGVTWKEGRDVVEVEPHRLHCGTEVSAFDWVFDCRGMGAKADFPDLRGVRGELFFLHAPEVTLNRPVRLMHPRYPLYVVPRKHPHYAVGATLIESEAPDPMTVRSSLELLSAAYAIHPGFAEATILDATVNCRPAFPDHHPRVCCEPGLVRINGLYRHGFLLAPIVIRSAVGYVEDEAMDPDCAALLAG
jgi:glycine oxidase